MNTAAHPTTRKPPAAGLTKSLAALEKNLAAAQKGAQRVQIPCARIKILPQIRKKGNHGFTEESLRGLGNSIKAVGQIQPITLRPLVGDPDYDYVLVAGERRLRGSMLVGLEMIDAYVRHVTDDEAKAIQRIENVHQEALDDAELLMAVKEDLEELKTAALVAKRWEKTESWVSKVLALDKLGEVAQQLVAEGLSGDREVLTTVARLERLSPELASRLVAQIRKAPAGANVRDIVSRGMKEARARREGVVSGKQDGQPKQKAKPTPEKALERIWAEIVDHGVLAKGAMAMTEYKAMEAEITAFLKRHWQDGKKAAQSKSVTPFIVGRLTRGAYSATGDLGQGFALIAFMEGAMGARFAVASILDAAVAARL